MKVSVDECPAGPVIDAAIAKVLGLQVEYRTWLPGGTRYPVYLRGTYSARDDGWAEHEDWQRVLPYSTNVAAAWWGAAESLLKDDNDYVLLWNGEKWVIGSPYAKRDWDGDIQIDYMPFAGGETVALAICRAFLKAKGMTEIEVEEESDGQS